MTLLAPNGKPSNLTQEQWFLVRTPEFKAWFGDWEKLELKKINDSGIDEISLKRLQDSVSKVVDENGEPLVVYHGSKSNEEFNVFKQSSRFEFIYFAKTKEYAWFHFTKDIIDKPFQLRPFFLNIRNLLNGEEYGFEKVDFSELKSFFYGIHELSKDIQLNPKSQYRFWEVLRFSNDIYDSLKNQDYYDGISFYENFYDNTTWNDTDDYSLSYVVMNPNQIKLADGTNTTFDGNNPDIRFEDGGEITNYTEFFDGIEIKDGSIYIGQKFSDVFPFLRRRGKRPNDFRNMVNQYYGVLDRLKKDNYSSPTQKQRDLNKLGRKRYIEEEKYLSRFYLDGIGTIIEFRDSKYNDNNPDAKFDSGGSIEENEKGLKIIIKNVNKENKFKGAYKRIFDIIDDDITFYNPYGTTYEELNGTDFKIEITPIPEDYIIERIRQINNVEIVDSFDNGGEIDNMDLTEEFKNIKKYLNKKTDLDINITSSSYMDNKYIILHYKGFNRYPIEKYYIGRGEIKKINWTSIISKIDTNLDDFIKLIKYTKWDYGSIKYTSSYKHEIEHKIKALSNFKEAILNNSQYKKGGNLSSTAAPKKEQIYGSEVNKEDSSANIKKAKSIKFDEKTILTISDKVKEHNKEYPNKKINLASAKAVVRRGMGAYSSSHRPTISGGKPNSRVAWGLARLNAFIYKIINGKSKSGRYKQDDDLIKELGIMVKSYRDGGEIPKANKMFHLPIELTVYVPSTKDVDKVISKSEMTQRVNEVKNYLGKTFGGFSASDVQGGFVASDGNIVNEDIIKVVSFAQKEDYENNKNELVNKITQWAEKWGQEAIGLEYEGDLYYVPEKLKKGGSIQEKKKESYWEGWGFSDRIKALLKGSKKDVTQAFKDLQIAFPDEDKNIVQESTIEIFVEEKDLKRVKKIANYNNLTLMYEDGGQIDYSEGWNQDYENDPLIKAKKKTKELATRAALAYATAGGSEIARAEGQAIQQATASMQNQQQQPQQQNTMQNPMQQGSPQPMSQEPQINPEMLQMLSGAFGKNQQQPQQQNTMQNQMQQGSPQPMSQQPQINPEMLQMLSGAFGKKENGGNIDYTKRSQIDYAKGGLKPSEDINKAFESFGDSNTNLSEMFKRGGVTPKQQKKEVGQYSIIVGSYAARLVGFEVSVSNGDLVDGGSCSGDYIVIGYGCIIDSPTGDFNYRTNPSNEVLFIQDADGQNSEIQSLYYHPKMDSNIVKVLSKMANGGEI